MDLLTMMTVNESLLTMAFNSDQTRRLFLGSFGTTIIGLAGCVSGSRIVEDLSPPGAAPPTNSPSSSRTTNTSPTATRTATPTETEMETQTATEPSPEAGPPSGEKRDQWTGNQKGTTLEAFDAFNDQWEIASGSAVPSEEVSYGGTGRSVFLDNDGDGRVRIKRVFSSPRDFSNSDFSLAVRLKDTTKHLLQIHIVLRDLFGNDRYLSGSIHPKATDRWLRLDPGVRFDRGTDMRAIKEVWIDHWVGTARSQFYVDDLRIHDSPDAGAVMFTFDDAHPRDYSIAFPTLKEYGYAGACFPPAHNVTENSNPSISEYQEMQEAGWDIGGHGLKHEDLTKFSRKEQRLILERNKKELNDMGFVQGPIPFRTPFSNYDTHSLDLIPEFFDASIVGAGSATGTTLNITDPRTIAFRSGDDYEKAKSLIDAAVDFNQLLGLTIHMRDMPSQDAFRDLIEYAAEYERQDHLEIITPSTLIEEQLPP